MKRLISLGLFILILFLVFVGFRFCMQKVPMGQVGVRVNRMGGGVTPKDLEPGYHLVIPGMHNLELMDARKQIDMLASAQGARGARFRLISKDQAEIGLDVTIIYSLEPGSAHKALEKYGPGNGFRGVMHTLAGKAVTEILGQLTAEEFFDAVKRTTQAERARLDLNRMMRDESKREYLVMDAILIRHIKYDERFEQRLLEKQLFDQERLLHEAEAKRESAVGKTEVIHKQTAAKVQAIQEQKEQDIQFLRAQTDAEMQRIKADADLYKGTAIAQAERYKREKIALGELEKTTAQALGDKAINAAYAGSGGQLLLVKKMIDNIQLGRIEINTNRTNPFSVADLLSMLGAGTVPVDLGLPDAAAGDRGSFSALDALRKRLAEEQAAHAPSSQPAGTRPAAERP